MKRHDLLLVVAVVGGLASLLLGCGPRDGAGEKPKLEAVDVGPALEIPTELDQQATQRKEALVGVLPSSFPKDLPIYLPASLVDFGDTATGSWVELLTPHGRVKVGEELQRRLLAAGWQVAEHKGLNLKVAKQGKTARLILAEESSGTLYRYEY
jgi:hypothetical protein